MRLGQMPLAVLMIQPLCPLTMGPQPFVPEGERSAAMPQGSGFARRAPHAIDPSVSASTGVGRNLEVCGRSAYTQFF